MTGLTPQQKQARRDQATGHAPYVDPLLAALTQLGHNYAGPAAGNAATLAFGGFRTTQTIYVCTKGAGAQATVVAAVAAARPPLLATWPVVPTSQAGGGGGYENMHAEMQIVEYVVRTEAVANYKADLAGRLAIVCIRKDVCADCCGWMARHGIAHGLTCGDRSAQGWRHPITRSGFRGEDHQLQYTPGGRPNVYAQPAAQSNGWWPCTIL